MLKARGKGLNLARIGVINCQNAYSVVDINKNVQNLRPRRISVFW